MEQKNIQSDILSGPVFNPPVNAKAKQSFFLDKKVIIAIVVVIVVLLIVFVIFSIINSKTRKNGPTPQQIKIQQQKMRQQREQQHKLLQEQRLQQQMRQQSELKEQLQKSQQEVEPQVELEPAVDIVEEFDGNNGVEDQNIDEITLEEVIPVVVNTQKMVTPGDSAGMLDGDQLDSMLG